MVRRKIRLIADYRADELLNKIGIMGKLKPRKSMDYMPLLHLDEKELNKIVDTETADGETYRLYIFSDKLKVISQQTKPISLCLPTIRVGNIFRSSRT